ncbi:FAD-dependent oxidoreductase [Variovorax sp. IB41]|uniref:FAD-dependent oxidoreductase n=1 Tax=Variovorax sp. IB41 TaxID=2779370 RepID=UPI0018E817B2|nr:FAD-dependent oxidoreductase [Variovorax sp. IB41]MBJ2160264.1 FAD-dependent oxidoreductase [Variovorax sp. IB41]
MKTLSPIDGLSTFNLAPGVHVIGLMEKGVTIYNQQVRAHNFAWALHQKCEMEGEFPSKIAILGGGITGLTTAACLLNKFPSKTKIVLFEKRLDLCPIQQGADHRWIHPHIYEWPDKGSDQPSTGLPLMRWEAGRASDVVGKILAQFRIVHKNHSARLDVIVGVEHTKLSVSDRRIEWVGKKTKEVDGFYTVLHGIGTTETFDEIVIATGFGLEKAPEGKSSISYWRNEQVSQPILGNSANRILLSGYGDGALTDLFRLTIERFRQETILKEIFKNVNELRAAELNLLSIKSNKTGIAELFNTFEQEFGDVSEVAKQLSYRLRKDTKVYLHLGGPNGTNRSIRDAFGATSSFLNRFMLFLLYKCGAFVPVFGELEHRVIDLNILPSNVLCRHGTSTTQEFENLLGGSDVSNRMSALEQMKINQHQSPIPWFKPGFFQPDDWRNK